MHSFWKINRLTCERKGRSEILVMLLKPQNGNKWGGERAFKGVSPLTGILHSVMSASGKTCCSFKSDTALVSRWGSEKLKGKSEMTHTHFSSVYNELSLSPNPLSCHLWELNRQITTPWPQTTIDCLVPSGQLTAMRNSTVEIVASRIFISCIGLVGNVILIMSIIQTKFSRVKSFEFFLIGLASANLEEIVIMNIYDIVILDAVFSATGSWSCRALKFLTLFGEVCSIFFTVLISIFRYQKLRDASKRVSLPICLDSIRSAWMVSGICVVLSILFSLPVFLINLDGPGDTAANSSNCPPDFFRCSRNDCPTLNRSFKYGFIMICNLLPLIIVTLTGCLIIRVLLNQRSIVANGSGSVPSSKKGKGPGLQRSVIAVLAATGLFQIDWTLYLIFQLTFSPADFPFWAEIEFFISIFYTSISPYVYGIGNNLFSIRNFIKK